MHLEKLRVGVVGVGPGGIGHDQHLPGWAKVPFVEVAALADISPDNLTRAGALLPHAKQFADWHEMIALADLDAIDICTPNRTHAEIALAALMNGKHVLCEKPLATSSAEVLQLQNAAKKSNRLLMTAQHLRFESLSLQLKTLIEAGALGEVYYARAQWLRRRFVPARATFIEKRLSGGAGFDIGVHVLDLAYWFMGAPQPFSVTATTSDKLAHCADLGGGWGDWDRSKFDVEDFAAGFVRFDNGAVLVLEASWLLFQPEAELTRVQCCGTNGGVVWPDGVIVSESNRIPWDKHRDPQPITKRFIDSRSRRATTNPALCRSRKRLTSFGFWKGCTARRRRNVKCCLTHSGQRSAARSQRSEICWRFLTSDL
jgi:predicted dehydrogenase